MEEDTKDEPAMGPDDPKGGPDEDEPATPGPGNSDAVPPRTGEEPSEDNVVRPD